MAVEEEGGRRRGGTHTRENTTTLQCVDSPCVYEGVSSNRRSHGPQLQHLKTNVSLNAEGKEKAFVLSHRRMV